jgi:L-amino acid N-acyltransferase YncA
VTVPSIRPATTADATAIATVHVDAWRAAYDGLLPAELLAGLSVDTAAAQWARSLETDRGVLVAEIDGTVAGFAAVGPSRDEDALDSDGELYAIYLAPTRWSTGVGHALHEAAIKTLAAAGYTSASLWVLANNARAIAFYERHGWRADGTTKEDAREGGVVFLELRMRQALPAVGS